METKTMNRNSLFQADSLLRNRMHCSRTTNMAGMQR